MFGLGKENQVILNVQFDSASPVKKNVFQKLKLRYLPPKKDKEIDHILKNFKQLFLQIGKIKNKMRRNSITVFVNMDVEIFANRNFENPSMHNKIYLFVPSENPKD